MTPYAAFITAVLIVGTVATLLALGAAAARPMPLPHPDAPDAEFEAWARQALGLAMSGRDPFETTRAQIAALPEKEGA